MNIHATIKEVSKHYTMPIKTGDYSWQFTIPANLYHLKTGRITIYVSGSYSKALETRRSYIAHNAVMLLIDDYDKAVNAMYDVSKQDYTIVEAVKRNIV